LLSEYFFVGREIELDDVFEYREGLLKSDPSVDQRANQVLKRLLDALGDFYDDPKRLEESLLSSGNRLDWQK
jgi:Fe-S-cluster formation regulator IscX/YfhJ